MRLITQTAHRGDGGHNVILGKRIKGGLDSIHSFGGSTVASKSRNSAVIAVSTISAFAVATFGLVLGAAPAQAADTATITGTITGAKSKSLTRTDLTVKVHQVDDAGVDIAEVRTSPLSAYTDGAVERQKYTVTGLPAGKYKVEVVDPSFTSLDGSEKAGTYITGWFPGWDNSVVPAALKPPVYKAAGSEVIDLAEGQTKNSVNVSLRHQVQTAAPAAVTATPANGALNVTVTSQSEDSIDGPEATGTKVTAQPGGKSCLTEAGKCSIVGLTNGTAYTITAKAQNFDNTKIVGWSASTAEAGPFTPADLVVPVAPVQVRATAGVESATVSWLPPAIVGSGPVLSYTAVSSQDPTKTCSTTTALNCTITGLAAGSKHTFYVQAFNYVGKGSKSNLSPEITVQAKPVPKIAQSVSGKVAKKAKVKTKKTLPSVTTAGQQLRWVSTTPKVCKVKAGKLVTKKKAGTCQLTAVADSSATVLDLRAVYTIKVKL